MKTFVSVLLVLLVPLTATGKEIDVKAVDSVVEEALKAWQVPGAAVAIVKDDRVVYLKGHGVREIGSDQPVTPDTMFAIASVTKSFTAAAVAVQVDDGKMAWDDPVRNHLDYFRLADPLAGEQVTLRDLLCHRTGLAGQPYLWTDSPWGREELIRRVSHVQLSQPFRTTWQYQNIMYLAAGQAAGATAGTSWEDVVQKRLFDPLGMTGANFSIAATQKAANHANPHRKDSAGKVKSIPWVNLEVVGPAGSINAHARDMAQWVRLQLGDGTFEGKRLLSAAQLREPHTPQIVLRLGESYESLLPETNFRTYGLGWYIEDYRRHLVVWHGGNIDGFAARVCLVPKSKLGLVILSNMESDLMPFALQNSLLDHVLSLPKKDWNTLELAYIEKVRAIQRACEQEQKKKLPKGTKPSRPLDVYTGTYEEQAYGKVVISLEDGTLQLKWNRIQFLLRHSHYDTFVNSEAIGPPNNARLPDQQIAFTLGAEGDVASLRVFDMDFKKTVAKPKGSVSRPRRSRADLNEPASDAPGDRVKNKVCENTSSHKTTMVTIEPDVQLEVLDWGGTGETMVLLAGLGDNAHVFDHFAHQFTDRFHVIGITRRGFGRSSQPAEGYDVATRARDDIRILDHFNIRQAVFIGHSIAGDELSKLGAIYPDRVTKLVYLDAYDYGRSWSTLPQPPSPDYTDADLSSIERFAAAEARDLGVRKPMSALCNFLRTDSAGKVVDAISPPEITKKIVQGSQQAQYDQIKAPVLAILVPLTPKNRSVYSPYYSDLKRDKQQEFDRCFEKLQKWQTDAIQRFRTGVKNARVVELPDSNHYVFLRDEAVVVRKMRKFLID